MKVIDESTVELTLSEQLFYMRVEEHMVDGHSVDVAVEMARQERPMTYRRLTVEFLEWMSR